MSLTEKKLEDLSKELDFLFLDLGEGTILHLIADDEEQSKAHIYLNCFEGMSDGISIPSLVTIFPFLSRNKRGRFSTNNSNSIQSEDDDEGLEII